MSGLPIVVCRLAFPVIDVPAGHLKDLRRAQVPSASVHARDEIELLSVDVAGVGIKDGVVSDMDPRSSRC